MFNRLFIAAALALAHTGTALAAPVVAITAPANNARYTPSAAVTLSASATDSTATITKVDFYNGATLIGTATSAPYTVTWSNVPGSGYYVLTAKATDSQGLSTTSNPIEIAVNAPPTVTLSAPAANVSYSAPAAITISANAADGDGSVSKVEFYNGSTLISTLTSAPYTYTWPNVAIGAYTLTAKATDDKGWATTSAVVPVQVIANAAPSVALTTPANNTVFAAPAIIGLSANATAVSGNSISQVAYYNGAAFIGNATTAPYAVSWSNVAAGAYAITARATDNLGQTGASSTVNVTVVNNAAPSVSVMATPANANAPATITLTATAADSDGSVAKVEFFNGTTLLATVAQAPYTYGWTNVAQGSYAITARATDNLGAATVSSPVTANVGGSMAQVYYIQSDQ